MNDSKIKILQDLDDKCSIYNILYVKSHLYYNSWSRAIHIPLVSISAVMTILNGSIKDEHVLCILNITFNMIIVILVVINANLKLDSKSDDFKGYQMRFVKLQYDCNKLIDKIAETKDVNTEVDEKIYNVKKMYDDITLNMLDIPRHICIFVCNLYQDDSEYTRVRKRLKRTW